MKRFLAILFTLNLVLLSAAAYACPLLERAEPKVGSTVKAGTVEQVALHFNSPIIANASTVVVSDKTGRTISTGKVYMGDNEDTVITRVSSLPPGKYKVTWNVLCDCGSITPGDYTFTVE